MENTYDTLDKALCSINDTIQSVCGHSLPLSLKDLLNNHEKISIDLLRDNESVSISVAPPKHFKSEPLFIFVNGLFGCVFTLPAKRNLKP